MMNTKPMLQTVVSKFTASPSQVRFALGTDKLGALFRRDDVVNLPDGDHGRMGSLKDSTSRVAPLKTYQFEVINKDKGIVQFGPWSKPRRGQRAVPVDLIEGMLGVQRLPATISASGRIDNSSPPSEVLTNILKAALESGAKPFLALSAQDYGYAIEGRHFGSVLGVQWSVAGVALSIEFHLGYDGNIEDGFNVAPQFLENLSYVLRAKLLNQDDRDNLQGHEVLQTGLRTLLDPFVTSNDHPLQLDVVDPHDFGWFSINTLRFRINLSEMIKTGITLFLTGDEQVPGRLQLGTQEISLPRP